VDGSCKNGFCHGGGVVRDHTGNIFLAFSKLLGMGDALFAEIQALITGICLCLESNIQFDIKEVESKML